MRVGLGERNSGGGGSGKGNVRGAVKETWVG